MSAGEATDAAKRKFAHQHPDWADGPSPPKPAQKHHVAPTTQTHHYVVQVCNLTGLEAVCEHNGRKAVKEKEVSDKEKEVSEPQRTRKGAHEAGEGKNGDEEQHGTFVLSVLPHSAATPTHSQKSVGYQGSDPFHTTSHENILTAEAREEAEKKHLETELHDLHAQEARLGKSGTRLQGERAQLEQYEHKLEQRRQEIVQKLNHSQANGNLGKHKAQQIHKQRIQLQHNQDTNNRRKARNAQAMADHAHQQAQNAKDLSHFHQENAAHTRFNLQLYTERGEPTEVDKITLTAMMSHHYSAHPMWKVYEAQTHKLLAAHNGMTLVCNHLLPPVVDETALSKIVPHLPQHADAYWLRNIHPRTYKIQLQTCHAQKDILIHVYPEIKSGLVLTINRQHGRLAAPDDSWLGRIEKYEEKFKKLFDILKDWMPRVENLEIDILAQGKLNLSNAWEEEPHGDEVVWKAAVDGDMDLIEASFRIPIMNINPLPKAVKDRIGNFIDAGIYFTFDGKMGANFAGAWTSREGFRMEKGGVGGTFALGMEGLIAFGKDGKWGRMEANGTSTIFAGAEVRGEEKALLLEMFWQFVHPFTADFAIFGPFDVEIYHWQHDLWRPGPRYALPTLHLFGGGE